MDLDNTPAAGAALCTWSRGVWHISFRAMGSAWSIDVCAGQGNARVPEWCNEAIATAEEIEQELSRFRSDSALAQLHDTQRIDGFEFPHLFASIRIALAAYRASNGAFNIAVGNALIANGYDESFEYVVARSRSAVAEVSSRRMRSVPEAGDVVRIDGDAGVIEVAPDTRLDLGGIGKGYAADFIAVMLHQALGCGVLVNAGGDMRTIGRGPTDSGAWLVGIDHGDGARGSMLVRDCGIATSGTYRRRWRDVDGATHHIIDPHTGRATDTTCVAATVVAPTAVDAEVAATTVVVSGDNAASALEPFRASIVAITHTNKGARQHAS